MSMRILCIDDSAMCLHGIRDAIEQSQHQCVGSFPNIADLRTFLQSQSADLLIAEMRVANEDTLEAWPKIQSLCPSLKLILCCYDSNPTHIARASSLDVWDYVLKRSPVHRLMAACESAVEGSRVHDSLILTAREYLNQSHVFSGAISHPLTRREKQVLVHLSLGLSNREIAESIKISLETVKEHVQNVLRKVKANDRTAAAVWAIRNGLPPLRMDSSSLLAAHSSSAISHVESVPQGLDRPAHGGVSS